VLGSAAVGKTCLVRQLCFNKFQEAYKVTLGADFGACLAHMPSSKVHVQIWDTAGQERFNSMGPAFYRGSEACVLVYDVTSHESLEALAEWKRGFQEQAAGADEDGFPFILVGNKCDLPVADHEVSEEEGRAWARDLGCATSFRCSAKEMTNVHQMMLRTVDLVLKRKKDREGAIESSIPLGEGIRIDAPVERSPGCQC